MIKKVATKPIIYAFIDSQNLNLGTSKDIHKKGKKIYSGWRLDFKTFPDIQNFYYFRKGEIRI